MTEYSATEQHQDGHINVEQAISSDCDVDISESDLESLSNEESSEDICNQELESDSHNDDNCEEHWDEVPSEILDKDIASTPLTQPECKKTKVQEVNALVFWFVYFLLLWQTSFKISDNGLAWLIKFILQFLKVVSIEISNDFLTQLITILPSSLYLLGQFIDYDKDSFTKYVVCPQCTKLYTYDSCLRLVNGKTVAKTCCNTYMSRGKKKICDATLVKKVVLKDGQEKFYPIAYYCSNSIINELEKLLQQKGMPESCEHWRDNDEAADQLSDVYSGQIWKDFQTFRGVDFLKSPRNYGFMLNFDFFQPMKHRKDYSVGVLYLVILNLPRSQRFKWENVIVVGIIPSMGVEPKNLNEFLQPAVKELKCLWKGMCLKSSLSNIPLMFRAALLSISADIPAARKLCGFKGHSAHHGCSRCLKMFPGGFGEKKDYSGFDRHSWPKRTNHIHRINARKIQKCNKVTKRKKLCQEYGINYWSPFLDLEYFDVVRFCTVDPMHNLFLGTAKYVFKLWDKRGIIGKKEMKIVEKRIEQMDVPTNVGRLPKKISSNYGSYTAEQWKNWTLIYSVFALKGVIGEDHIRCWQPFVLACKYLCRSNVSRVDLQRADLLLLKFCQKFEGLYGKSSITPNMHLHCHLKDIVLDHGPVYSFWCFSFERYNGIMGSITTNKRSLELQLMRKLMLSRYLNGLQLPVEYGNQFEHLVKNQLNENVDMASSKDKLSTCRMPIACPIGSLNWALLSHVNLPSAYKILPFDSTDLDILLTVYKALYPTKEVHNADLAETVKKYATITIGDEHYGSKLESRSIRSARIYASWAADNENLNLDKLLFFAGNVNFYFSHSLKLNERYVTHVFACVTWHKPDDDPDMFGNPTKTWKARDYIAGGPSTFLPVQRIHCRYSAAEIVVDGELKLVTVSLDRGVHCM